MIRSFLIIVYGISTIERLDEGPLMRQMMERRYILFSYVISLS